MMVQVRSSFPSYIVLCLQSQLAVFNNTVVKKSRHIPKLNQKLHNYGPAVFSHLFRQYSVSMVPQRNFAPCLPF